MDYLFKIYLDGEYLFYLGFEMICINLGCGNNYKEEWINVDVNKEIKADVYADFTKKLPFKNNYADLILLDNIIEHIPQNKFFFFMEEIHRVCKDKAIIEIYVPHYSGMHSFKHPTHYNFFGIGSFDTMRPEKCFNGERYTKARFELKKEKLLFFHHALINFKFLSKIPINWLFNISRKWQWFCERFMFFGFDEVYYKLEVVKNEN